MAPALLEIDRLEVAFGDTRAVRSISVQIAAGEKFALVGESGSGKTATALAVVGLLDGAHCSGAIRFDGHDLTSLSEPEMRRVRGKRIGMVFQEPLSALNPLYPVGAQIGEVLRLHAGLTTRQGRARADPYPPQLSGGQRQRAVIAMALACRPSLLIADEPTTALDVTVQAQIVALLEQLQREMNMAILFITHDLSLARRLCDRVGVMEGGVLVEVGAVREVFGHPEHKYTQHLIGCRPGRALAPGAS